jgi:hypothetical protein
MGASEERNQMKRYTGVVSTLAAAGIMLAVATAAQAECLKKAGQGTGSNDENAKFQAWEAVLQATDWGSWAGFMASGMKVGSAPGYKVTSLRSRCKKGGLGSECIISAILCK